PQPKSRLKEPDKVRRLFSQNELLTRPISTHTPQSACLALKQRHQHWNTSPNVD
ncbi:uncharacterized protein METZ01_LOCUS231164, partial [marine metagenome]